MPMGMVPPTRNNLLRIRKALARTQQGHQLLERKRQILVMELMGKMEAARVARQEAQEIVQRAFKALERAAVISGAERLMRESLAVKRDHALSIRTRSVMGVGVPEITFRSRPQGLPFGLLSGASGADEVRKAFQDALESIVRLAEVENAVLRLAREVKRTRRRVHALENIFIPTYQRTLKFIGDSLEEREREELLVMKKVKRMRQSSRE